MRLFIAIDVSKEVHDYLPKVQSQLDNNLRFVKSFHLTLKYLGEVSEDLIPNINTELENIMGSEEWTTLINKYFE